jgi:hypothetical protein
LQTNPWHGTQQQYIFIITDVGWLSLIALTVPPRVLDISDQADDAPSTSLIKPMMRPRYI